MIESTEAPVVFRGEPVTDPAGISLVRYLHVMREMRTEIIGGSAEGFVYMGMEDLLLQHGRLWQPQPLPKQYSWRTPTYCFDNCYKLAQQSQGKLRYVEGIAMGLIPMHHAWCVTPDGKVVDPTWKRHDRDEHRAYIGVVLPLARVRAVRKNTSGCAVLDNWEMKHSILREPFTEEQ